MNESAVPHHRYQDVFLKQQSSVDNKMIHKVLLAIVTTVQDLQDLSILWSLFCQQVCLSFLMDFVLRVAAADPSELVFHEFATEDLRADRDIVRQVVSYDGAALEFASDSLCSESDIVLRALAEDFSVPQFASSKLLAERDFLFRFLTFSRHVFVHV